MKRLLLALAIAALAPLQPAGADTLPQQISAEAARLLTQVNAAKATASVRPALKPAPLAPGLVGDLQRFGLSTSRLSLEIDTRGGPADLRCIFRGMAEETGKQLTAASAATTGAAQADALARLSHMLQDAMEIAPAAGVTTAQTKTAASSKPAAGSCPVVRNF